MCIDKYMYKFMGVWKGERLHYIFLSVNTSQCCLGNITLYQQFAHLILHMNFTHALYTYTLVGTRAN